MTDRVKKYEITIIYEYLKIYLFSRTENSLYKLAQHINKIGPPTWYYKLKNGMIILQFLYKYTTLHVFIYLFMQLHERSQSLFSCVTC